MHPVISVLAWTGVALIGLALLLAAALASPLRVRVEADELGGSGSASWLGWRYGRDYRSRTWDVHFVGVRIAGRPWSAGNDGSRDPPNEAPSKEASGRKRRSGLSPVGVVRLAGAGLREARRLVPKIRLEHFHAAVVVATPEPALTGELYGYSAAIAAAVRGRWPGAHVDLGVDFLAEAPRGSIDATMLTRPIWWTVGAVRVCWVFLMERRRTRR